ncbi:Vitamin K epoxide reductase [Gracilaria domingensis]|nr:Vitamin K epoxide reductase [Gracilaria domingensis]
MRSRLPALLSFVENSAIFSFSRVSHRTALSPLKGFRFTECAKRRRVFLQQPSMRSKPRPDEEETVSQNGKPSSPSGVFISFRDIRKILVAVSAAGMAETTYLTYNKLFSSPGAICGTQGCLDVLSGPFSTFLGIPLTVFGVLAYSIFAYLCTWPLSAEDEETHSEDDEKPRVVPADEVYAIRDAATRPLMLAVSTAMFTFSVYLMSLLVFVIRSMCPYCVFSACLSTMLFVLTAIVGKAVPEWKTALRIGAMSASFATVCAAALFFLGLPAYSQAQGSGVPQAPPEITLSSDSNSVVSTSNHKTLMFIGNESTHKSFLLYLRLYFAVFTENREQVGAKEDKNVWGLLVYTLL